MILAYEELLEIVQLGVITRVAPSMVNGSSINLSLGATIRVEIPPVDGCHIVSLSGESQNFETRRLPYEMKPGEFVLAHTQQVFNMPLDLSAEFKTRSTIARLGLEHLNACWFDPGWSDSTATLELKNLNRYHHVRLTEGMQIGQVIFHRHRAIPDTVSYKVRGRYNRMTLPEPAKRAN